MGTVPARWQDHKGKAVGWTTCGRAGLVLPPGNCPQDVWGEETASLMGWGTWALCHANWTPMERRGVLEIALFTCFLT